MKKIFSITFTLLIGSLLLAMPVHAQTVAPVAPTTNVPAGFVASSDVLAINCKGWGIGNLTTESYDFLDLGTTKANKLFLTGDELTAPGCGFSVFGGGLSFEPNLTSLLAKTNVPSGNFLVSFDASVGNAIPTTGSDHVAFMAGVKAQYILSDNVTWNTIRVEGVDVAGSWYPAVSTGIAAYFGGTAASPAVSTNVRSSLLKKAARAMALTKSN